MSAVAAIEIEGVEFAWPGHAPVLSIERLHVPWGERFFVRGASGSGKSTLLGLIGGVLAPRRGVVRVLGAGTSPALRLPIVTASAASTSASSFRCSI